VIYILHRKSERLLSRLTTALLLGTAGATASAETYHYGYGFTPEEAMNKAIAAAQHESPARCLAKGWNPNINRDCRRADAGQTFVDGKGNDVGPFECKAQGSKHRGSCR